CRTDMALSSASVYVIASERPGLCSSLRDNNGVFELFFFTDPATTEIYTLSLHDALPIYGPSGTVAPYSSLLRRIPGTMARRVRRSEEHTSELQSRGHLVCRLLLEKKKTRRRIASHSYPPKNRRRYKRCCTLENDTWLRRT